MLSYAITLSVSMDGLGLLVRQLCLFIFHDSIFEHPLAAICLCFSFFFLCYSLSQYTVDSLLLSRFIRGHHFYVYSPFQLQPRLKTVLSRTPKLELVSRFLLASILFIFSVLL